MPLHELKIGNATIGGPLGSHTGLLCGSIFYDKHSLVTDAFAGTFDQKRAERLVNKVNTLSERYGVQMCFDVIAASPEAMDTFLRFVSERSSLPMMINASESEILMKGLETAAEIGVLDRCIYASLNMDSEDAEFEALRKYRPAAVMIMANDGSDPSPDGCCRFIEDFYLPILKDIGVEAPIADLGAMDPPSIGVCMRGIAAVREHFGFPAGCAFSNVISQWTGLRELGKDMVNLSLGAAMMACRAAGGDFLHYGIIEKAEPMAHVAGSGEVFYGFAAQELDGIKLPDGHPLLRMFKLSSDD